MTQRAARRLAELIAAREAKVAASTGLVLLVVPQEPSELDLQFAPTSESVMVGQVFVIGRSQVWHMYWNPETDQGRIRQTFDATV